VPIDGLRNWKTRLEKQTATGKKWRLPLMAELRTYIKSYETQTKTGTKWNLHSVAK
jgi:hypothetical protein